MPAPDQDPILDGPLDGPGLYDPDYEPLLPPADPTAQEAGQRFLEALSNKRERRDHILAGAAALTGLTLSGVLLYNVLSLDEQPGNTGQSLAPPQTTTTSVSTESTPPFPAFSGVSIHYAKFGGTLPVEQNRQQLATDVKRALHILDDAHEGQLGIAELPIITDIQEHDLTAGTTTIDQFCAPKEPNINSLSDSLLSSFDKQTPLSDKTLDIIVVQSDDSKGCLTVPIAHAHRNDVIIYKAGKSTAAVIAHEINHLYKYHHDNVYDASPSDGVVKIDPETPWIPYGNNQTIAGDGARAAKVTDKDPLSGYELLRNGVIKPDQVAEVGYGETKELGISALTTKGHSTKLIKLPLSGINNSRDIDSVMLELSYEDDQQTLKAYGAGVFNNGKEQLGATYAIRLVDAPMGLGLGKDSLNRPITIDLGGEKIELTLKQLRAGDQAAATVVVSRS